jgi:hypothetical protein
MDERHHSAFTGARATVDPWVGGRVVADDGFIDATHVYLVTGSRIAMTWRTRDFPKGFNDSHVDITFEPVAGGTKIEVTHTKLRRARGDAGRLQGRQEGGAPSALWYQGEPAGA